MNESRFLFPDVPAPPFGGVCDKLTAFLASPSDGTFYPGHASALVRLGGKKYLFDPVMQRPLLLASWLYFPVQVMDPRLLDVDAVFISHFHEDHFDPRFLRALEPGVPIYIVRGRAVLEEALRDLGLNVRTIEPFELTQVGEGASVLGMPSDYNAIDSSFILKGESLTVYQGNDNFLSVETLERARALVGRVHHAFVPYAYIWWYPFRLGSLAKEAREEEGDRLVTKYLDLGLAHGAALDADVIVPCGGNLVYHDAAHSEINAAVYTPYDFRDYAKIHRPDLFWRVLPLVAGDYVLHAPTEPSGSVEDVYWSASTTEVYTAALDAFLTYWKTHGGRLEERPDEMRWPPPTDFLRARIEREDVPALDYDLYFSRGKTSADGEMIRVDLLRKQVYVGDVGLVAPPASFDRPWVWFDIEEGAFDAWVTEQVPFEVILESARFTVWRAPERHDSALWAALRLFF